MKTKLDRKKWAKRVLHHAVQQRSLVDENLNALREKMRPKSESDWKDSPPPEPGRYDFWCNESGRVDVLNVYLREGDLWVTCPDIGAHPLDIYHAALSNPKWRKAI